MVRLSCPRSAKDGIWVVGFRSKQRSIEVDAVKFEAYIREEGLDDVVKARGDAKATDKPGREVYSRCAKTLLKVGNGGKDGHDVVLGLRLEIVPETNPYLVTAGDPLTFRVLFDKTSLAKGLVTARCRTEPTHTVSARTDDAGRVTLKLDRAGEWLVKCTHMMKAPEETGMDWESVWASVTFDLDAAKEAVAPAKDALPAK